MAEFSHEADGINPDTPVTIWTGDVEAERLCYSYAYNSCCTGGFNLEITITDLDGNSSTVNTFQLSSTSDCFRETTNSSYNLGGRKRIVEIKWYIDDADTECEEGWLFNLKIVIDAVLDYTTSCGGDMDYIRLIEPEP